MKWVFVVVAVAAACGGTKPVAPRAVVVGSSERIVVGPAGITLDGKLVAPVATLAANRAEIAAALPAAPVTFDVHDAPASLAIAALRVFADRTTTFTLRDGGASTLLCSGVTVRTSHAASDRITLSLLLDTGRTWVGRSRVNEFQEVPTLAALETTLRDQKASTFFVDRHDAELAAQAGTSREVLAVLGAACRAGFTDLAVLPPDRLSARPQL